MAMVELQKLRGGNSTGLAAEARKALEKLRQKKAEVDKQHRNKGLKMKS